MTDAELVSAAITASGLTVNRFATEILTRDDRTVRRWLDGTRPLPPVVRAKLEQLVTERGFDESAPATP